MTGTQRAAAKQLTAYRRSVGGRILSRYTDVTGGTVPNLQGRGGEITKQTHFSAFLVQLLPRHLLPRQLWQQ